MSLHISSNKYNDIKKMISEFKKNENYEFEARFYGKQFKNSNLDIKKFTNVLNYFIFKKENGGLGYKYKKEILLDIRDEFDEKKRLTIIGNENIKKYWLSGSLKDLDHKFIKKENVDKIDINEYSIRFSLSKEDLMDNENEDKEYLKNSNKTSKKTYRLKNRYEVYSENDIIRIDFTSVKQSTSNASSFRNSNTVKSNINYEIEIELLHNNELKKLDDEIIFKKFLQKCYIIISILQNNSNIMSQSNMNNVIENYSKLIDNNNKKNRNKYNAFNNNSNKRFIAANPVTLHLKNIEKSNRHQNILNSYAVTLKADGERRLLYVNPTDDKLYLIDINFNIVDTGYEAKEWANSIIECEYIRDNNLLLLYDILFVKGKDVRRSHLKIPQTKRSNKNKGRLEYLDNFLDYIKKSYKKINEDNLINIQNKKYLFSSTFSNSIFEKANELWSSRKDNIYDVDGLIFVPIKEHYPLKSGAWFSLFKWKPPELNTIDFLIKTIKDKNGDERNPYMKEEKLLDGTINREIFQYKTLQLFVGGNKRTIGKNNRMSRSFGPVLFNPYNSNSSEFNRSKVIIDSKNKMYATDPISKKVTEIIDDCIVEFGYNPKNEIGFKWVPYRVRYDKTQSYKAGEKVFGNYKKTANDIFKSLQIPITTDIILSGKIPEELRQKSLNINSKEENNNENNNFENSYYKNNEINKYNAKERYPYQNFHNLYIKEKLLRDVSPSIINGTNKMSGRLVDFGSGKGGDITKWKRAKLAEVIGIEYDIKNIEYAKNLFRQIPRPKPKVVYLRGDLSKLLFPNQDSGLTEANKNNLRNYIPVKNSFDIVSIQFALHYFFKSEIILRTLLQNVTDNLKVGGFFIGTCIDGKVLFKKLKGKKKIEGKTKNGETLWSIKKEYTSRTFTNKKSCVGKEVEVYVKSIGREHTEYLVNFDYLDILLEEYGFAKVRVTPFEDSFKEMEENEKNNNNEMRNAKKLIKEITDSEKEFSFLNNSFVYKKMKTTPDSVYSKLIKMMEKEETKKYKKEKNEEVNKTINDLGVSVVTDETEELIEDNEKGLDSDENFSDESDLEDIKLGENENVKVI